MDRSSLNLITKQQHSSQLTGDFIDKEVNNEKSDRQKAKQHHEINTAMLQEDKKETAWTTVRGAIRGCAEQEGQMGWCR